MKKVLQGQGTADAEERRKMIMGLKESTPKGPSSDVYRRDREVPAQGRLTCFWLPRIKSDFSLECILPGR